MVAISQKRIAKPAQRLHQAMNHLLQSEPIFLLRPMTPCCFPHTGFIQEANESFHYKRLYSSSRTSRRRFDPLHSTPLHSTILSAAHFCVVSLPMPLREGGCLLHSTVNISCSVVWLVQCHLRSHVSANIQRAKQSFIAAVTFTCTERSPS